MNFALETTFDHKFTTRNTSGVPTTLAGTPGVEIYEDNSVTQITTAETLTIDFDSKTGFNNLRIAATAANGFERGKNYAAVISAGTVGGTDVTGETIVNFSIRTAEEGLALYAGPRGPGIYVNDSIVNTGTVWETDGTELNPVSTLTAARTLADIPGIKRYYLLRSIQTLAATHADWEFIGTSEPEDNILNLGSQNVNFSRFFNCTVEGTQSALGERIQVIDGQLGRLSGGTVLNAFIYAIRCALVGEIQVNADYNVFDSCFTGRSANTPIIDTQAAGGTIALHHFSDAIEFENLTATSIVRVNGNGLVRFDATCNVNADVDLTGNINIQDLTAGMADLTTEGVPNRTNINAEVSDVLKTDTTTLPGQTAPPLAPTFEEMLSWLYKVLRNRKTQTATEWNLLADNETTVDAKATVSNDGTTAIKQEIQAGP